MKTILPKILHGLQSAGEAVIPIVDNAIRQDGDESKVDNHVDSEQVPKHMLFLTTFNRMPAPPLVHAHQVPVRVRAASAAVVAGWDLSLQLIMRKIDGVNHVQRIAGLTGIDLELVQHAIRQLLYFGYVTMIDIFQYSNVYAATAGMADFAQNKGMLDSCIKYVSTVSHKPPRRSKVFALYSAFNSGTSIGELCEKYKLRKRHNIDDRRFVAFGVMNDPQ